MALENKLGITDSAELAREEEKISKAKATKLFDTGYLDNLEAGTINCLVEIHKYLFEEIYEFAGKIRNVPSFSKDCCQRNRSRVPFCF